jgi:hypothetical protein
VQSDSLETRKSDTVLWCPHSAILADCFMCAHSFNSISFEHYPREANVVAHRIAKFSYDCNYVITLDGDPPNYI